jgi:multidrug transporter EmrE-like cation transporter
VLLATVLALGAAVLHASWNLVVKQSPGDRYVAIWGQFLLAAPPMLLLLARFPPSATAWKWAAISGAVHVPYAWFLARGYAHGDFSLVYPIARGGGAALGAIAGIAFLHDHLHWFGLVAIAVIVAGLIALPDARSGAAVESALLVALTIALYSAVDAKGIRVEGSWRYVPASAVCGVVAFSVFGVVSGRSAALRAAVQTRWRTLLVVGLAANVTYGIVQYAMKLAPVGYVSALRESSVVLAAFMGARVLKEDAGTRRLVCSGIVAAGVVGLIAAH